MCFLLCYTRPIFRLILLDIFHFISLFFHQNRKKKKKEKSNKIDSPEKHFSSAKNLYQGFWPTYKFRIKQSNAMLPVAFYPSHAQSAEGSPGFPFSCPLSGITVTHCIMKTKRFLVCLVFFYLSFNSCEVLTATHINREHKSLSLLYCSFTVETQNG